MNSNDAETNSIYRRRKVLTTLGAVGLGAVALNSLDASSAQAQSKNASKPAYGSVTYQTENSWGSMTEWHEAPDLTFTIDDGIVGDISTLSWRDQSGNTGNISFQSDGSSFLGYYQKVNEGPIAYRGTKR